MKPEPALAVPGRRREGGLWLPVAAGTLVFASLLLWAPHLQPPPSDGETVPYQFPFPSGATVPAPCASGPRPDLAGNGSASTAALCRPTLLAIAGHPTATDAVTRRLHLEQGQARIALSPDMNADWRGPVATFRPDPCEECAGPVTLRAASPSASRAGFDPERTAMRFTVYAFTPRGTLLASNAADADVLRFDLDGDFTGLPHLLYWFGRSPAPAGTTPVPPLVAPILENLEANLTGLPVGGIATRYLERYPYSELFGPLWVTLQVDGLVPAGSPEVS